MRTTTNAELFDELKHYVRFSKKDEELLHELCEHSRPHFVDIAREFYERVREHDDAHAVFRDEAQIARLHNSLVAWLARVLTGPWDAAYAEKSLRIGHVHVQIGLPQRYMFTAMSLFRVRLETVASDTMGARSHKACCSLSRILDIELALMNESYREAMLAREVAQEDAYRLAIAARGERSASNQATEAKRALHRYVNAVELAGTMIIGLDMEGRVQLFNRRAEEVTGYRFAEVRALGFAETLLAPNDSGFDEVWREIIANDAAVTLPMKWHIRTRNGSVREIAGHASRSPDEDNGDVILVSRDVTEEEMFAARKRQTERLAAVGTLAAGLAHEIRNPLNGAQLHLTFLKRALGKTDNELVEAVDVVASEVTRLSGLVSEFLDFARPTSLNTTPVNVQELCRHTAALVRADADATRLTLDMPTTDLVAEIDREKIEQVLLNLMGNAVDAAKTSVRLRAFRRPREAVVEVIDDGPGLSEPDLPIFDAFFSTKANGTGLGLAIAHRIVSDHGGSLHYERKRDETIFRMSVPVEAPNPTRPVA